jgi:hypothetical protein
MNGRWAPVGAVAGVAVVLAAVLVPLMLRRADAPAGASGHPESPPPTGRAVPVEGVGTLLRDPDGRVRLCATVIRSGDLDGTIALCGSLSVPATGVDRRWLTHSTPSGQALSDRIRVEGTYGAGILAVTRLIGPAPEDGPERYKPPALPCAVPPGGWAPGYGLPGRLDMGDTGPLDRFVEAHSDRFARPWVSEGPDTGAVPGETNPAYSVFVVGTTGDVRDARSELRARYVGNLCVYHVRYSRADLDRIAKRLHAPTSIVAGVDESSNRVRVHVVALDPATVARLDEVGRGALILGEPILQWLE